MQKKKVQKPFKFPLKEKGGGMAPRKSLPSTIMNRMQENVVLPVGSLWC